MIDRVRRCYYCSAGLLSVLTVRPQQCVIMLAILESASELSQHPRIPGCSLDLLKQTPPETMYLKLSMLLSCFQSSGGSGNHRAKGSSLNVCGKEESVLYTVLFKVRVNRGMLTFTGACVCMGTCVWAFQGGWVCMDVYKCVPVYTLGGKLAPCDSPSCLVLAAHTQLVSQPSPVCLKYNSAPKMLLISFPVHFYWHCVHEDLVFSLPPITAQLFSPFFQHPLAILGETLMLF